MRTPLLIMVFLSCLCSSQLRQQTGSDQELNPTAAAVNWDEVQGIGLEGGSKMSAIDQNADDSQSHSVLETPIPTSGNDDQRVESAPSAIGSDEQNVLNQWLTRLVLKHLPHDYEKEKNWGKQVKRWSGVKMWRDEEGKLETKRRYKMVNHGTWRKYGAQFADPEQKFAIEVSDFGRNADRKTIFDVSFRADLILNARQSKWVKGVQLYSFSAEGSATVRLTVQCELGVHTDFTRFPPDLVLNPAVTSADLEVDDFELQRVSKAGGEVAQQITRLARKELDRKIEEQEEKLVKKINEEIQDNRDKLRLSIADTVRLKWFNKAKEFIPSDVKDTISSNKKSADGTDKR